ncbi:MAG: M20 family metallopeptidase [Chloroflexi bacterium]|nr:M20 family metallopeptidase [Chloroflexota bacterium]
MSGTAAARAVRAIDERREDLVELSLAIHRDPEIAYQEHRAASRLADFLERAGFAVTRGYRGIETAYRGDASGTGPGPTVAILAEYDALNEIGHACGHNLMAMMGAAAAIGARAALAELPGRVAAIGTPAEEGGGGKVALLKAGGFDDVDAAMIVHPNSSRTLVGRHSLAANRATVEYFGRAAHGASQPEAGINALDGVLQLFNAINAMRQQLRPDARVMGIITAGGSAPNVIPDYAQARFSVRALDRAYQQEVLRRFTACAEGAARATGTEVRITVPEEAGYDNMVFSRPLAERWGTHMAALGHPPFDPKDDDRVGSTDMGNLMQVLPAIHPYVAISNDNIAGHSIAFREAAATELAHERALAAAKAMALTTIDLLGDPDLLRRARAEFEERRAGGIVKGR